MLSRAMRYHHGKPNPTAILVSSPQSIADRAGCRGARDFGRDRRRRSSRYGSGVNSSACGIALRTAVRIAATVLTAVSIVGFGLSAPVQAGSDYPPDTPIVEIDNPEITIGNDIGFTVTNCPNGAAVFATFNSQTQAVFCSGGTASFSFPTPTVAGFYTVTVSIGTQTIFFEVVILGAIGAAVTNPDYGLDGVPAGDPVMLMAGGCQPGEIVVFRLGALTDEVSCQSVLPNTGPLPGPWIGVATASIASPAVAGIYVGLVEFRTTLPDIIMTTDQITVVSNRGGDTPGEEPANPSPEEPAPGAPTPGNPTSPPAGTPAGPGIGLPGAGTSNTLSFTQLGIGILLTGAIVAGAAAIRRRRIHPA